MRKGLRKPVKAILAGLLAVSVLGTSLPVGAAVSQKTGSGKIQAEFFVSPTGSDENDGSYEKPFATLQAARDAVRDINDNMTGDIYVFVDGGKYYMDETLVFTEEDSGTNGYQIIYRNLDGLGSAELIGGKKVESEWELVDASGDPTVDADADLPASAEGKVYKTHVGTEVDFNTLYVNDKRATLARTQNRENENGFSSALTPYMRSAGGGVGDLIYNAGDLDEESLNGLVNAQARGDLNASVYMWDGGYWDWMTDTIPVSAIDTEARRLTYKTVEGHPEMYRPKYATRNNARYFVQGNLGFLDAPGEYYFNDVTGDLYYYPEGDIKDQEFVIPCIQEIVRVEGTSKDSMVENITFSGLQFKDTDTTEWYAYGWNWGDAGDGLGFYPPEAEGSTQPSYCESTERIEFQFGNITLRNTKNISVLKSHIKNSGMFGINMHQANQNTLIEDCLIEYTGHGGINVDGGYPGVAGDENGDGYSRDNEIRNCLIHDIGELIGQASGITIMQSSYNTVSNVEIYNSPRRGIFLSAGHSRNKGTPFPNGDADYNTTTDLYTHHNTLEYIYLHDCQQDGGDDGALFVSYLYNKVWYGREDYKPNYINQMVIENTAANTSMTDIAPNNINLDMGCSGLELSNVKSVNTQHFNLEVNTITQYGDTIKFDNVNADFGTHTNYLEEFDDSKMEYDKIGITTDFPAEYLPENQQEETPDDIYFQEDFENGLDYSKWSSKGGTPEITTEWMSEGALGGRQALQINSDKGKPVLYREFDESLNKVVTMQMFDRGHDNLPAYMSGYTANTNIVSYGRVDNGEVPVGMGIDVPVGGGYQGYYVLQIGDEKVKTDIQRFFGWHELKWDYSSGTDVKLYFDGQLVKTLTEEDGVSMSFDYVSMGSETGSGITFFDELVIYGGKEASAPGSVPLPEIPAYDSSEDNQEKLSLDFEDGELPDFYFTTDDPSRLGQEVLEEDGNMILKHYSGDGHAFYQTNADWQNYMLSFKWKFGGWGDKNVLNFAYDNFTIYLMTTSDGSDKQNNNPAAYQVVYRRNKNGSGEFPAGTPYFEICKHTPSSDSSLGKVAVPEGFDDTQWHEFQIQTFDGKVGVILDGQQLISIDDGQYDHGGIGFGGINATAYLDDIKILSNPTYVEYDANLGLTNININGTFNPNYYDYYVTVKDNSQPVTFTMPKPLMAGTTLKATLNGQELIAGEEAINLDLKDGINELVLTEKTSAGDKNYRITIHKIQTIVETAPISPVETQLGTAPVLPQTVLTTFADGTQAEMAINWRTIRPQLYKQNGTFTATGSVAGFPWEVETTVTVNGFESLEELPVAETTAGTAPALAETVLAHYTDGDKELPVTFYELSSQLYQQPGTIIAIGTAEGYAHEVVQVVKVSEPTEEADKTLLQKTYDYALTLSTEGVTDSAKAYFEKVLAEAKAVLDNASATQEQVNTAWDNLLTGIWGLGLTQGDKTMLEQLIAKADGMMAESDKYVQDNWQQLVDALDAAKKVMADGDAMEEDVQPAAEALLNAILAQRFKADKSILEELVNKAEGIDLDGYTAESVAVFTAAFQNAKTVLADETLSEDDQAIVDEAVEELEAAIENLSANDEDNTSKPSEDDKDNSSTSEDDSSNNNSNTESPATGDEQGLFLWAAAAMLALTALVLTAKRRSNAR